MMAGEEVWNELRATCKKTGATCYGLGYTWAHTIEVGATAAIPPNAGTKLGQLPNWEIDNGFSSNHPGGVSFLFVDGSVQFLSDTISLGVYRAMATIQGGEALSE
jgi:prepilin-type processing-associated H-X9-DG protein